MAKCSLLKFTRSYFNSWCRKLWQWQLIVSVFVVVDNPDLGFLRYFDLSNACEFWSSSQCCRCSTLESSSGGSCGMLSASHFHLEGEKKKKRSLNKRTAFWANTTASSTAVCSRENISYFHTQNGKLGLLPYKHSKEPTQPWVCKLNQVSHLCCGHTLIDLQKQRAELVHRNSIKPWNLAEKQTKT